MGDFLDAECFAVAVLPTGDLSTLLSEDRDAVKRHLNFARNLHIETRGRALIKNANLVSLMLSQRNAVAA